jgi:hydroxypyruvate isomerase
MKRREFIASALAAGVGTGAAPAGVTGAKRSVPQRNTPFRLKYAPHFGMFRHTAGDDLVDQIRFMADQGFTALEDNGMRGRPVDVQKRVAREMERRGMTMGVFVATADFGSVTFAAVGGKVREKLLDDIRASVETAKRVNATWCTVVPGCYDPGRAWDYQTANIIENLKRCAELCEPAGLVMVLEPLNPRDHPGLFLTRIPQAYLICQAVGSPSCKILDDLYHQQITEGNLIPNLETAWSEIAYIQVGDNPGRKEPTTGEINYRNVFGWLHARGYTGIIGMEHGNSRPGAEGEQAVIDAYLECDAF